MIRVNAAVSWDGFFNHEMTNIVLEIPSKKEVDIEMSQGTNSGKPNPSTIPVMTEVVCLQRLEGCKVGSPRCISIHFSSQQSAKTKPFRMASKLLERCTIRRIPNCTCTRWAVCLLCMYGCLALKYTCAPHLCLAPWPEARGECWIPEVEL